MKVLPGKSILRISLALLSTLIILIISLQITVRMVREKMENYAEAETEQKSFFVNSVTNMLFMSNEWILNGYLAGFVDVVSVENPITHKEDYRYVFTDKDLSKMDVDEMYERLTAFLAYHTDYYSASMIFEPNVIKEAPEGIAATMRPTDPTRYNLLEHYSIYDSNFYKLVKKNGTMSTRAGGIRKDSTFVSSVGVPFYDKKGRFIGEFWVDTDADFYSGVLSSYKNDENAVASIVNKHCRIIASTNEENNGKLIKNITMQVYGVECPDEWYSQLKSSIALDTYSHFSNIIDGESIVTYVYPISNSEYKLLVLKPEKELYTEVNRFMWIPNMIMLISVLMISICMVYIFVIYKKKNDQNTMMEGELNVAANIQRGILPLNPQNGENRLFDIYGFQRQAKTVGGDLYDFVQRGDLLHFCIGDVSGKGMPAALVMTELCSLYRYIITHYSSPDKIVAKINKAVMERSDDSMLCTLFVGVLNLKTGMLEFCNAGHNPPIFIRNTSKQVEYLTVHPNMPIYAFENYAYKKETMQLEQGDRLFLYTDGVVEAKNDVNKFYGKDATLNAVRCFKDLPFKDLVRSTMLELKAFSNKAEQGDDVTILCVEYKRSTECISLHFDSVKNHVTEIVKNIIDACGLSDDLRFRLAVEEPVQNIADYSYTDDGPLDVDIETGDTIEITLIDGGIQFNPLESKLPDFSVPILEREVGGLGIFLTREVMNDMSYQYIDKQNRLTLKYIRK